MHVDIRIFAYRSYHEYNVNTFEAIMNTTQVSMYADDDINAFGGKCNYDTIYGRNAWALLPELGTGSLLMLSGRGVGSLRLPFLELLALSLHPQLHRLTLSPCQYSSVHVSEHHRHLKKNESMIIIILIISNLYSPSAVAL